MYYVYMLSDDFGMDLIIVAKSDEEAIFEFEKYVRGETGNRMVTLYKLDDYRLPENYNVENGYVQDDDIVPICDFFEENKYRCSIIDKFNVGVDILPEIPLVIDKQPEIPKVLDKKTCIKVKIILFIERLIIFLSTLTLALILIRVFKIKVIRLSTIKFLKNSSVLELMSSLSSILVVCLIGGMIYKNDDSMEKRLKKKHGEISQKEMLDVVNMSYFECSVYCVICIISIFLAFLSE